MTHRQLVPFIIFAIVIAASRSMKTLFLSRLSTVSSLTHFRDAVSNIVSISKIAYVPTASYCLDKRSSKPIGEQRRRARYDAKQKAKILSDTFGASEVVLLELDAQNIQRDDITKKLEDSSMIYVDGGNTFYLQHHILRTGFWDAAEPLLNSGCLYAGASAGAIVAGKSIRTAYWKGWDDPTIVGDDFDWNEDTLRGRGLCDYSMFMHYDEAIHKDLVRSRAPELDHPVRTLTDNMAILQQTSHEDGAAATAEGTLRRQKIWAIYPEGVTESES
jgi:peptidase E